jgi:hypothetical protein
MYYIAYMLLVSTQTPVCNTGVVKHLLHYLKGTLDSNSTSDLLNT